MRGNRGQTSLDFAVGMSTLLLVFAFVLTFVPGILSPFTASGQEETVTADRVADHLAEGLLAESDTPYVLSTDCTEAFFNNSADDDKCAFENTDPFRERLGISQYERSIAYRQQANVSLIGDVSGTDDEAVLCRDDANLVEKGATGCTTPYEIGSEPPTDRGSVVTTRRVVSLDGYGVTLVVRTW